MFSENNSPVVCPKCGETDNIERFDKDVYIVKNENDFVKRKLYGCKKCTNLFTYDGDQRKEKKNIDIQSAFAKIAKQCEKATSNVTLKM